MLPSFARYCAILFYAVNKVLQVIPHYKIRNAFAKVSRWFHKFVRQSAYTSWCPPNVPHDLGGDNEVHEYSLDEEYNQLDLYLELPATSSSQSGNQNEPGDHSAENGSAQVYIFFNP